MVDQVLMNRLCRSKFFSAKTHSYSSTHAPRARTAMQVHMGVDARIEHK